MKIISKFTIFTLLIVLPSLLSATSPAPYPFQLFIFTPFLHTEITEFTVTDQEYQATFIGGLVKANPNTSETDDLYWVILPAGTTTQGNSDGEAAVTLVPSASFVFVSLTAGIDVQARIQLLDDQDGLISETAFSDGENLEVNWVHTAGEPLVSKLLVIIDGGTAETGISRLMYADPDFIRIFDDAAGSDGGGSFTPTILLILIITRLLIYRHRHNKST